MATEQQPEAPALPGVAARADADWIDAAAAREYFGLYRKVLRGKWKTMEIATDEDARLAGRGDDGYFDLRLAGARVTSLEGMASSGEARPPVR